MLIVITHNCITCVFIYNYIFFVFEITYMFWIWKYTWKTVVQLNDIKMYYCDEIQSIMGSFHLLHYLLSWFYFICWHLAQMGVAKLSPKLLWVVLAAPISPHGVVRPPLFYPIEGGSPPSFQLVGDFQATPLAQTGVVEPPLIFFPKKIGAFWTFHLLKIHVQRTWALFHQRRRNLLMDR